MASEPETRVPETATFELKRFEWLTPDRLGVSGMFAGLQPPADGAPVLVIRAGDRVLRLPTVADSRDASPQEGEVWQAAFEWREEPVAFDAAELEFGADLVVDLPELDGKRRFSRKRVLEVRTAGGGSGDPQPPDEPVTRGGAVSVGSQIELVAAQEEVREVRVAMLQTQQELARVHDDLREERERRAGDGERFREGLAKLRDSAEAALEEKDAALKALGGELETVTNALNEAEPKADALRERVAELERDSTETERLRAELERTRARADAAHTELETARGAVDRARDDAERLIARLTASAK